VEWLESWLGPGRRDVIHFNFGLHGLHGLHGLRLGDGKLLVALDSYEKNLRAIVVRLMATGATRI
jgi:acyl-CoA thioesterase-1